MITKRCIAPLELQGAKLPLCKVAVQHLLTPRGRYMPNYVGVFLPHMLIFSAREPPLYARI